MGKARTANTILTVLCLDGNKVSDEGAKALGKVLQNTILTALCLDGNKVSDEGAKALGKALESNNILTVLCLKATRYPMRAPRHWARRLHRATSSRSCA